MMEMKQMDFCQSCAMPLNEELRGTEKDGSKSEDYCHYCYQKGEFTAPDISLDEMSDICVTYMLEEEGGPTEAQARAMMSEYLPKLKRWAK